MQDTGITLSIPQCFLALFTANRNITMSAPMCDRMCLSMCLCTHAHFCVTGSSSHGKACPITLEINTAKHSRGNHISIWHIFVFASGFCVNVDTDKSCTDSFSFFSTLGHTCTLKSTAMQSFVIMFTLISDVCLCIN